MTIYIEKLKLEKTERLIYLTLCDFLLGSHNENRYNYENVPVRTDLICDDIISVLSKHNIFLGKNYGLNGISITTLLESNESNNNLYIEIPTGHIKYYSISDLIKLSLKYKIIFTDFEEGDSTNLVWFDIDNKKRASRFSKFLIDSKINVDNVFFTSASFEKTRICKEIKIFHIWLLMQTLTVPYVHDILLNNNKQKYLDILSTKKYEKFAVFKNWRARRWRLALLGILDDTQILNNIDWSLIGEFGHRSTDLKEIDFNITHFLRKGNVDWLNNSSFKNQVTTFIQKNSGILPKFLSEYDKTFQHAHFYVNEKNIKTYMYSIDVDTANLITEKPIKSFLQGSMPIVIYPFLKCQYIEKIQSLGFKLLDTEFDNSHDLENLMIKASNKIHYLYNSNIEPNLNDILHNFDLCVDKSKLVEYFTQPLIDTFK